MPNEKVAVVTGGAGDIGSAIVKTLSQHCLQVISVDCLNPKEVGPWQDSLRSEKINNVSYVELDVTDFKRCEEIAKDIYSKYGRYDILINAAGITRDNTLVKMDKEDWEDVLEVNLNGVFNLTRHTVPFMVEGGFGRIVNISSVNAQKGQFGQCNYAAAKAGMHGFTKSLAQELVKKGITVNTISPGYVNTKMVQQIRDDILDKIKESIPAGRLAEPTEIAWIVEFLINDKSQYITGANIAINGGLHMF